MPFEIALMILFSAIKWARLDDFGDDWLRVALLLAAQGRRCALMLSGAVRENRRAVLRTDVRTLAVVGRRIVDFPKNTQQIVITDLRWIVGDLYRLCVARRIAADLAIRGILRVAAGVAARRVQNARYLAEGRFDAPEAAGCERGGLSWVHTSKERRPRYLGCMRQNCSPIGSAAGASGSKS